MFKNHAFEWPPFGKGSISSYMAAMLNENPVMNSAKNTKKRKKSSITSDSITLNGPNK